MADPVPTPDEEIARLYGLPLEEFTRERNATAKRLGAEGERAGADRIGKLAKPNLPAWAINQAVRSDPAAAEGLIDAGKRLERAQGDAARGKGAAALREAMAGQQEAVERMLEPVRERLETGRRSSSVVDRARETLRALAADPELRAEFAEGRLTRDREAVGFGAISGVRPPREKPQRRRATSAERREAVRREQRAARSLETAVRRVREAQRRLDAAQRDLEAAEAGRAEAERERSEREAALADARADLERLRSAEE